MNKRYFRFSATRRFQHIVLIILFAGLVLTGLPQMYAEKGWAQTLIRVMDGIESVRIIHRTLAGVLVLLAIWHVLDVSYRLYMLRHTASLIPTRRDIQDARDWGVFSLGLRKERPRMPFYNFSEKWDYWMVVLGLVVMAISGFMLWNPTAVTQVLPDEIIPTARTIHGREALLLLLLVGIGHLYNTVIKQFNRSMWTGSLTHQQMVEEHAEVLEEQPSSASAQGIIPARRERFALVAGLLTLGLLAGLFWFITFEETAIDTVPRNQRVVFMPDLNLGNADAGQALWGRLRCIDCHGEDAGNIANTAPPAHGTRLSFEEFYFQVRDGKGDMPPFSREEISDLDLLNLWTWLHTKQ